MGNYREKTCPTCGTVHRKRGPYCSRSCGNSRTHSQEHKEHLARKTSEAYHRGDTVENTERFVAGGVLARKKALNKDDELIIRECADVALQEEHEPSDCILGHFGLKR